MTDHSDGTRSLRVAHDFYRALQAKDIDALAGLWTTDAVYRVPATPDAVPGEFAGRDVILAALGQFFTLFGDTRVTWDVEPMADPRRVLATWVLEIELLTGGTYRNRGASIFRLEGDRIAEYTEYVDTAAFLALFAANTGTVHRFFASLREKDIEAWGELWHERGAITLAQPVEGYPSRIERKDDIVAACRKLFTTCEALDAELTGVHPAVNSDAVCVQYTVHAKLVSGAAYTNDHIAVFRFEDGLIRAFHDSFDARRLKDAVDAPPAGRA
ncbi:nuclear transport factor 2 family protein [Streptomyces pseudovenezuelae]|uniref:nuclear transport factor 2 family protein n=1 Tax=Streptomyces pseudovenezuelae TaxID=67350 RepID=UPI0034A18AC1